MSCGHIFQPGALVTKYMHAFIDGSFDNSVVDTMSSRLAWPTISDIIIQVEFCVNPSFVQY